MADRRKRIEVSAHAVGQLASRGGTASEVEEAIRTGEELPARQGRLAYRKNFTFESTWQGVYYRTKQLMPVVAEEQDRLVVVTVYVFYF